MITPIRFFSAILLGLALSNSAYSSAISASNQQQTTPLADTIQQSEQTNKNPDEAKAPEPKSPDQNGIYRVGGNVLPPKLIYTAEPKIPKKDRKLAKSFTTVVQLTVEKDGSVKNAYIRKSSAEMMKPGNDKAAAVFDQSALDAVGQYRFQPATLNGRAVPVLINIEVNFQMF